MALGRSELDSVVEADVEYARREYWLWKEGGNGGPADVIEPCIGGRIC